MAEPEADTPNEQRAGGGYTSDYEDVQPTDGSPPRPRSQPAGSEDSAQSDKLMTDPASGLSEGKPQAPNQGPRQPTSR